MPGSSSLTVSCHTLAVLPRLANRHSELATGVVIKRRRATSGMSEVVIKSSSAVAHADQRLPTFSASVGSCGFDSGMWVPRFDHDKTVNGADVGPTAIPAGPTATGQS
jgi:hypothetical protein